MRVVIDSDVLIDCLNGKPEAREEIIRWTSLAISRINWIEVMVGAKNDQEQGRYRRFLGGFELVPVDNAVSELAVDIRQESKTR